jgi:hypothetical protein
MRVYTEFVNQKTLKFPLNSMTEMKHATQMCHLCNKVESRMKVHNRTELCDKMLRSEQHKMCQYYSHLIICHIVLWMYGEDVLLWEYPHMHSGETHCKACHAR